MRKAFPKIVESLMIKNKNIFCLLGDIGVFSFRNIFKNYKDRILNMSTMEQSMVGFGAGLAKAGFIPIIHSISPFLILRALEQIKIDLVYNKICCNLVSVGASNDYAKLGATHNCYEDVSVLSNYKINVFLPSNSEEFKFLLTKNYNNGGVNYFRLTEDEAKKTFKKNGFIKFNNNNKLVIFLGNSIKFNSVDMKKTDIYYINSIVSKINLNFVKNYKKIVIVEPYFGNVIERKIRDNNFLLNQILTIGYKKTIVHRYGNKKQQDNYLNFNESKINKKIYEFFNN